MHVVDHDAVGEAVVQVARPCDSACAHECTAPRSFWNAIAPIIELISMSPRASRSRPFAHRDRQRARGDAHALERDAVAQRVIGRATGSDSTLCVSASMPVAAVIAGGRSSVSSGSANTALASSCGREDDLLDVRVVVGDHRRAADLASRCPRSSARRRSTAARCVDRPHLRMVPRVLEDVARVRRHQRDRLGDVERRAAAEADDASARCAAIRRGAVPSPGSASGCRRSPKNTATARPGSSCERSR